MMTNTQITTNRTLILAVGESATVIVEAVHPRLAESRIEAWPIAALALTAGAGESQIIPTIRLSTDAEHALDNHIDEITAAITTALAGISHVPRGMGRLAKPPYVGIDVYLVAALDDPAAGALVDVAYLVRQLISRRLNTRAHVSGMLLLPDTLVLDHPERALAPMKPFSSCMSRMRRLGRCRGHAYVRRFAHQGHGHEAAPLGRTD
jgi:hypothetical protein